MRRTAFAAGTASGIAGAGLQEDFNTSSGYQGFGSNLTMFTQRVVDTEAVKSSGAVRPCAGTS